MSALLAGTAMRTKVGNRSAKQVLEHLCNYADENDRAWPSVSTLADECECSPSTIQRALRYLEDAGMLERDTDYGTRYGADRSPYVYHITIADAERIAYTHQRAKTKKEDRARARKRGSTHDTPHGGTNHHDGVAPTTPRGAAPTTPRGVAPTNKRGSTHDTQTYIEHPLRTSRESTRAKTTQTKPRTNRRQALADLTPDHTHQALADALGLDLDLEAEKFRDRCLADGRIPADPAAALRNWLRRGRELGLGSATAGGDAGGDELTRRARRLVDTSTILGRRQPDRASRMRWVPAIRRLLADGCEPVAVVDLIASGDPDELAALGLDLDDIDRIA